MIYESKSESESEKLVTDANGEFISPDHFSDETTIPEENTFEQEYVRLSNIIIIERSDDILTSYSNASAGNPGYLSKWVKALVGILGAGAVGTFIYKWFNGMSQSTDFLSTLSPEKRKQASDLIENIKQFNAMSNSSGPGILKTKESLLNLLINSSLTDYPAEFDKVEQSTKMQRMNNSLSYTLSTSGGRAFSKPPQHPTINSPSPPNIQHTPASEKASDTYNPVLDKQELDNIYELEQSQPTRQTRSINYSSMNVASVEDNISYEQAIKNLFLDKLSTENHASYKKFLETYADDFFDHYVEYSKQKTNPSMLTIHFYNVFNTLFTKKIVSAPKETNQNVFFVLHALLNLSQVLKKQTTTENVNIKVIDTWSHNNNEIKVDFIHEYLKWMSPQTFRPLDKALYTYITNPLEYATDGINYNNAITRMNKLPKIIKSNSATVDNIRTVLNERSNVKVSNMYSAPTIGMDKIRGQNSASLLKMQKELQMENINLNAELRNLKKHATTIKNPYPHLKIEYLRRIKHQLDGIYHSRLMKEKAKAPALANNIHGHMADLIPSMILEIGINQKSSPPLPNTISIESETDALDFSKQYLHSLHQDAMYYDYALAQIKKTSSMLSNSKKNIQHNHMDIFNARTYATVALKDIVGKDFSLHTSEEISNKLADLLIEGDEYYSRLYVIMSAIFYYNMRHCQQPSSLDILNPQEVINTYLQDDYEQNEIHKPRQVPNNFMMLGELKNNFHFESQKEYNQQFSDYKGASSLFEAETVTRSLINSAGIINLKGVQNIEWFYAPPAQVFHYGFTSSSGGLTLVQFATNDWLVISSYNGQFVAKTFTDSEGGSSDSMLSVLKKPREIEGAKQDSFGFKTDSDGYVIPNRFYPNINNENESEQDKIDTFLSKLHNSTIKKASITINPRKDIISSTTDSSYEIIIRCLDKDLQTHADALKKSLDYSGLLHKIATVIVPFYDVIYKSVTDEAYKLNADDIVSLVLDAVDIVITVVSAGISATSSLSKAVAESTVRLSKSGLTRQVLKKAVLKDIISKKIISKNALASIASFADDLINPVPYNALYSFVKKTSSGASKISKALNKDILTELVSKGAGDFSFGLKQNFIDTMTWRKFKIQKPPSIEKMAATGKFKGIYSSRDMPGRHFIKNKNNYYPVKYDDVLETWRVQSPNHLDNYQLSFPIEIKDDKWMRLQSTNHVVQNKKHHIKNNDILSHEAINKLGEYSVNKANIKGTLHQVNGPDTSFLYYSDEMGMYIKNNKNEYYDFEFLAQDHDIAFIGKRGEKRLTVIYNRNNHKFDVINSYWENGNEIIIKGSNGDLSKTISFDKNTKLYTLKTDSQDILLEYDEMNNLLKKSYVTGVTRLKGNVWRKEYDDFFIYEGSSTNSRLIIDAHGGETDTWLASEFDIPEGSQFNFYSPHGTSLQVPENSLEQFVQNKFEYAQKLQGGQKSPDYILYFYEDPVSIREIAQRNRANILQIKTDHEVRLSEVIKKVSETKGKPYTQFDIAVCRPQSGFSGIFPTKTYKAKTKN